MKTRRKCAAADKRLREVAQSLRKRHLSEVLQDWRHAIRQVQEVRRSRAKRARLIRLVRKHRLLRCLKKLRPVGMTIENAEGITPYFHNTRCNWKCHAIDLLDRLRQVKQFFAELKTLSLDSIIANLRTLLEEGEIASEKPFRVRFMVHGVELNDVMIGDLEVLMNLEEFDFKVWNCSADTESRGGYQHPHVNSNGDICWNDHDTDAREYHAAGDFLALRDLVENLLRTYNPQSPYINLEDWEHGVGGTCDGCGERWPEDDLSYIESLRESLCRECSRYCDRCGDYVRLEQYDSLMEACDTCVDSYAQSCAECGGDFWNDSHQSFQTEDEEGKPITVLLCPECGEAFEREKKRKEEESYDWKNVIAFVNENDPDPLRLLAPPMAVPSYAM